MKSRNGFVSNSSSSSFILSLNDVSQFQLALIKNHSAVTETVVNDLDDWLDYKCPWTIDIDEENIIGHTDMDNFDMHFFLTNIGIDDKKIGWKRWHSDPWTYNED